MLDSDIEHRFKYVVDRLDLLTQDVDLLKRNRIKPILAVQDQMTVIDAFFHEMFTFDIDSYLPAGLFGVAIHDYRRRHSVNEQDMPFDKVRQIARNNFHCSPCSTGSQRLWRGLDLKPEYKLQLSKNA